VDQVIQIIGALLVLTAYTAGQTGRWTPDDTPYLWFNMFGSAILAVLAAIGHNWGFLLLEGVWAIVTARSLIANARSV
jgi:hypothetical protein